MLSFWGYSFGTVLKTVRLIWGGGMPRFFAEKHHMFFNGGRWITFFSYHFIVAFVLILFSVPADAQTCTAGNVRLSQGTSTEEGYVQICHDDTWKYVCDDSWDVKDANIACRQAGFSQGAYQALLGSAFSPKPMQPAFLLAGLRCVGNEMSLFDCLHRGLILHGCDDDEVAGVRCLASTDTLPTFSITADKTDFSLSELDSTTITFTVTRSMDFAKEYKPTVRIEGDLPTTGGLDITRSKQTLTFADSDTMPKTFIQRVNDRIAVVGQSLTVTILDPDDVAILDPELYNYNINPSARSVTVTLQARSGNMAPTGAPTITGNTQEGETLTASTSSIADSDGLRNPEWLYQWIRVDNGGVEADIPGATSETYTLTSADIGSAIKVKVTFTDDLDNQEMLTSQATVTITAAIPSNNPATGAPTITGNTQEGETLTASTSGIVDSDGLNNSRWLYQWIRVITAAGKTIFPAQLRKPTR